MWEQCPQRLSQPSVLKRQLTNFGQKLNPIAAHSAEVKVALLVLGAKALECDPRLTQRTIQRHLGRFRPFWCGAAHFPTRFGLLFCSTCSSKTKVR